MNDITAELHQATYVSCRVCRFLASLPVGERAAWIEAMASPRHLVSHSAIRRTLAKRDVSINESSVRRHRLMHGDRIYTL